MTIYKLSVVPDSGTPQHRWNHFNHSPGSFEPRRRFAGRVLMKVPLLVAGALGVILFAARAPQAVTPLSTMDLRSVAVPGPSQDVLNEYIVDKTAAIQLGKALFWDIRVGSDNKTACASCHSSAGADTRLKNQLDPGLLRRDISLASIPDRTFQLGSGPNYQLKESDFPFTRFLTQNWETNDPNHRIADVNDVASSQGVFNGEFIKINVTNKGAQADDCRYLRDPDNFHIDAGDKQLNSRRVEPRNTPTVINAVFNFRNF